MDIARIVAAVVVGGAFLVAGASKLAARDAWASQARGLGAPSLSIPVMPWVELVIGAALVAQFARQLFAVAALVLLVAFTVLIVVRLRAGQRPPCACFGAWSAKPIGVGHVARNLALLAAAAIAAT
ncbi:MauE/DoxX family redox-associated membrane protein [Ilumatobacter coccineus]|uniref:Methylamine utilisation protein MauE domain-containing protein n=1 Tax=Ilumatobacter coccineus (strain NBRC 103263 / KCTC 29153 / YM16-304) TaxID=1313172 RepID=A0A6C7E9F2_ILUCY|nr:MauE/DoxX family redox-associated membrane protein [Ilumatobacter coccineus]BAN01785.1 hypothetical protein YM304_14710 [Ilumatobacter coccineus YM16-304]